MMQIRAPGHEGVYGEPVSMKVLVPLDGSPQSETVIPFLQLLARKTQVRFELLRCYEPVSDIYSLPPDLWSLDTYSVLNETIPASLSDYLEAMRAQLGEDIAMGRVRRGKAAAEILEESAGFDMVVMASHGRRGLDRLLLGGVTTKVVRGCPKPVLVVAGPESREPRLDTILVAIDGSECAMRAFESAKNLARAVGAVLVLYQAVKMSWSSGDPDTPMDAIQTQLETLAQSCEGVETRVRVYPTDSAPYIVERAEELKADLIVMGSHGRKGLQHLLMGSVAEHVVHHARCPVMVVH